MKRSNEGMRRYVSRRERMWKHMYVRKAEWETGGKRQVGWVGGRQIKREDSCRRPLLEPSRGNRWPRFAFLNCKCCLCKVRSIQNILLRARSTTEHCSEWKEMKLHCKAIPTNDRPVVSVNSVCLECSCSVFTIGKGPWIQDFFFFVSFLMLSGAVIHLNGWLCPKFVTGETSKSGNFFNSFNVKKGTCQDKQMVFPQFRVDGTSKLVIR